MAAVPQPAKKSYFFGKGYRDVGNTIKGAWRRNFASLGKFKNKVKGKTSYKEEGGWAIDKDTAGHGGRKWKLKNKKGNRIASLGKNGEVLGK